MQAPRPLRAAGEVPAAFSEPAGPWQPELPLAEQLRRKGAEALTDAELLALVLDPRNADARLREVRELLRQAGGVKGLARASYAQLGRLPYLAEADPLVLLAALELGRRRQQAEARTLQLRDAAAVAAYVHPRLADLDREAAIILLLDRQQQLLAEHTVSVGGVSGTVIDPKIVFREALLHLASGVVLVHNHPSGSLTPSEADRQLTAKIRAGGRALDVELLDHLIVSYKGYFSFAENGLL